MCEVLGLTLSAERGPSPVTIVEIRAEGVAATWNKAHAHSQQSLRIDDVIWQVNDVQWSPGSPGSSQAFIDSLEEEFNHAQARRAGKAHTLTLWIIRAMSEEVADQIQPEGESGKEK